MRILIADNNPLFRDALGEYISQSGLALGVVKCADLISVIDHLARLSDVNLVLIDQNLEGISHIEDICDLIRRYAAIRFSISSTHMDPNDFETLMRCGLWGYFKRNMSGRAIIEGLMEIKSGKKFLSRVTYMRSETHPLFYPVHTAKSFHEGNKGSRHKEFSLTDRESEVLAGLVRGLSNAEIGHELGIQLVTVKLHMRNLTRKMGARNRTEAALIAQRQGLAEQA